jgi:AmmeMemoRadiSam system protein A
LRGCIGTVTPDRPLHQAVSRMAVSAACDDPRFPPLQKTELPQTSIEISRLSPLFAGHPDQIRLGTHGVCLVQGHHRSVFLPQVATLYHWDRDTLLSELCLKAMLPAEAWKHLDTTLMLFEAEVFSDENVPHIAHR